VFASGRLPLLDIHKHVYVYVYILCPFWNWKWSPSRAAGRTGALHELVRSMDEVEDACMLLCLAESRGALVAALASLKSRCAICKSFDPSKTLVRFERRLWLKALIAHEGSSLRSLTWLEEHHATVGWVDASHLGVDDFRRSSAILTLTLDTDDEVLDAYAALHDAVDDAKIPKRYKLLLETARRLGVINEAEVGQLNGYVDGEVRRVGGSLQCVPEPDKPESDRRDTMRHMLAMAVVPALAGCRVQLRVQHELNGCCGLLLDVPTRFEGRVGVVRAAEPTRLLSIRVADLAVPSFHWSCLSFTYTLLHALPATGEERIKAVRVTDLTASVQACERTS
jgi:hypothetical protein